MSSISKTICLICNDAFSMFHFRKDLIRHLISRGHIVTTVIPPAGSYKKSLERIGAKVVEIDIIRFISPIRDIKLCIELIRFFRSNNFDIVHTMTLKPNLYAAPIAKLFSSSKVVGLVSGSGYLFSESGKSDHPILSRIVSSSLKLSFYSIQKVWFQNPDDCRDFIGNKLISGDKCVLIRGSGINLDEFHPNNCVPELKEKIRLKFGLPVDCQIVLMVAARRIASKGVREFAQAAALLLPNFPNWRFLLIAPDDPGTPDQVEADDEIFNIEGLAAPSGFFENIQDIVAVSDIVTLPSYYQEGLPRFLLEGMACGKPIVTTNHTGCRETVLEGQNGFLVPPKNHEMLAKALERLMDNEKMRLSFGKRSRLICEREFSEKIVCNRVSTELYGMAQ